MQLAPERIHGSSNYPNRSQIAIHLVEAFWQTKKQTMKTYCQWPRGAHQRHSYTLLPKQPEERSQESQIC